MENLWRFLEAVHTSTLRKYVCQDTFFRQLWGDSSRRQSDCLPSSLFLTATNIFQIMICNFPMRALLYFPNFLILEWQHRLWLLSRLLKRHMTVSLREACPAFYSMKLSTGRCWRLKHGTTCTRGRPCSPSHPTLNTAAWCGCRDKWGKSFLSLSTDHTTNPSGKWAGTEVASGQRRTNVSFRLRCPEATSCSLFLVS